MKIKSISLIFSMKISLIICLLFCFACRHDDPINSFPPDIAVHLSVDNTEFTGTCPHTFTFTGLITVGRAGKITYTFMEGDDGNFSPNQSHTDSVSFDSAGSQTVTWGVTFTESTDTFVILQVQALNDPPTSNVVKVNATCL